MLSHTSSGAPVHLLHQLLVHPGAGSFSLQDSSNSILVASPQQHRMMLIMLLIRTAKTCLKQSGRDYSKHAPTQAICVIVLMALQPGDALNVTAVPYGVLAVPLGEARTFQKELDVVLMRSHPRVIARELLCHFRGDLDFLLRKMSRWADTQELAKILCRRISLLDADEKQTREKRWAPLEPIGAFVGGLFGLATRSDAERLRAAIGTIAEDLKEHQKVITKTVITVNQLQDYVEEIADHSNMLVEAAEDLRGKLGEMAEDITVLKRRHIHLSTSNLAEAAVSILETYHHRSLLFEANYAHIRDMAEVGHLTESLVSKEQLRQLLRDARSPLHETKMYANAQVRLLELGNDTITYSFKIPVVEAERFSAWQIVSVPYQANAHTAWITPEISAFAVSASTGDSFSLEKCTGFDPILCRSPVRMQTPPCAHGIISNTPDLLNRCMTAITKTQLPHIQRVNEHQLLLATGAARVDERCPTMVAASLLKAGTYLLTPRPECTIAGPSWSFQPGITAKTSIRIVDEFVLPADIDVDLKVPEEPTVEPWNFTRLEELRKWRREELDTIHRRTHPEWLTKSSSYLSWFLFTAALVTMTIGGGVWLQRRYRCLRCRGIAPMKCPTKGGAPRKSPTEEAQWKNPTVGYAKSQAHQEKQYPPLSRPSRRFQSRGWEPLRRSQKQGSPTQR